MAGETTQVRRAQEHSQPSHPSQPLWHVVIEREVVVVAGDQPAQEEVHAGDRRVQQRQAAPRVQICEQVRGLDRAHGIPDEEPSGGERDRKRHDQRDIHVARDRDPLRPTDLRRQVRKRIEARIRVLATVERRSQGRGSHRGLLGGDRSVTRRARSSVVPLMRSRMLLRRFSWRTSCTKKSST